MQKYIQDPLSCNNDYLEQFRIPQTLQRKNITDCFDLSQLGQHLVVICSWELENKIILSNRYIFLQFWNQLGYRNRIFSFHTYKNVFLRASLFQTQPIGCLNLRFGVTRNRSFSEFSGTKESEDMESELSNEVRLCLR